MATHSSIYRSAPGFGMHWAVRAAGLRVSGGIQIVKVILNEKVLVGFFCLRTSVCVCMYVSPWPE